MKFFLCWESYERSRAGGRDVKDHGHEDWETIEDVRLRIKELKEIHGPSFTFDIYQGVKLEL